MDIDKGSRANLGLLAWRLDDSGALDQLRYWHEMQSGARTRLNDPFDCLL
jgi:hypothetical protein